MRVGSLPSSGVDASNGRAIGRRHSSVVLGVHENPSNVDSGTTHGIGGVARWTRSCCDGAGVRFGTVGRTVTSHRTMAGSMEQREEKKQVLSEALDGAPTVFLHLDARRAGVKVPENHSTNPKLILRVGYMLTPPINLDLGDEAVTCTLSFNRAPFFCVIPWDAIYAVVGDDGRAAVWPDDVPPEAEQLREVVQRGPALTAVPSPPLGTKQGDAKSTKAKGSPRPNERLGPTVRERPVKMGEKMGVKMGRSAASSTGDERPDRDRETPAPVAERKPKRELPPYLRVIN